MKIKIILACFLLFPPLVYADVDTDNDGIIDSMDNCIEVYNPEQVDTNQDGFGNMCDPDVDNDGNVTENDEDIINAAYGLTPGDPDWNTDADLNSNGEIDTFDVFIWIDMIGEPPGPSFGFNSDGDGWIDEKDNCPGIYNPDQTDTDNDGIGDECEGTTTTTVPTTTTTSTTTTTTVEIVTTNPVFVPTGSAYFTEFPEKIEVFAGDSITVNGKFGSTLNYNLYNVEFSLEAEGLDLDWYVISPPVKLKMEEDEEVDVSIDFNIPEDAEIYTYFVDIKALTGSKIGLQTFSKTFNLLLKEKLKPLTTSSTSTTTTTIPEEERVKSTLSGIYSFIQSTPSIVPVVIIIVLISIVSYKITNPKSKGKYVYGKGWVKSIKTFKSLSIQDLKGLLTKW